MILPDAVSQWTQHTRAELDDLGVVIANTSEVLTQLAQITEVAAPTHLIGQCDRGWQ